MSTGYEFVPLPEDAVAVRRAERANATHDRRLDGTLSGSVELELVLEQPVHVGSGHKGLTEEGVVRAMTRSGSLPAVPGATIKGTLRSRFEAVTRSCAGPPPRDGNRATAPSQSLGTDRAWADLGKVRRHPVFTRCTNPQLCLACSLMGYQEGQDSLRGRLSASDFVPTDGTEVLLERMPPQFGPRPWHLGEARVAPGGKHFVVTSLHGRKFACGRGPVADDAAWQLVEVLPAGTRLTGQIRLWNVTDAELGALLAALGLEPRSRVKLGAGKGHGFGRCLFGDRPGWKLRDHRLQPDQADAASWLSAFASSPDRWPDGEQALVRIHHAEC